MGLIEPGYLSVDYSRLTPMLVEAIKEQQKIIEDLKTTNKEQKKLNTDQNKSIEELKAEVKAIQALLNNNHKDLNTSSEVAK